MKPGSQSPIVKAQSSFRFRFLFKVTTNPLFIECRVISPSCDDDDRHNFDEFSAVEYYHDLAKELALAKDCSLLGEISLLCRTDVPPGSSILKEALGLCLDLLCAKSKRLVPMEIPLGRGHHVLVRLVFFHEGVRQVVPLLQLRVLQGHRNAGPVKLFWKLNTNS
ncbi:hypothetical protein Salat_1119800 [Sesamum alatum]|uniref:Uncharacterized protein n=1 Tax=Sesamum alatum TaxID=300844 RepID=A0AAE1YN98_9LAMI|nr:hypothetical protein Salat_1119800 [Sesamum alatum]